MNLKSILSLCIGTLLASGCASATTGREEVSLRELPTIPSSITEPQQRALYVLDNFWTDCNFRDYGGSAEDSVRLEQDFVNFVQFYQFADPDDSEKSTASLLDAASASPHAYRSLCELARKYLYHRASPYYDETVFIPYLRHQVKSPLLSAQEKLAPQLLLEMALKNRPGERAADIRYTERSGKDGSLSGLKPAQYTLLIFYDPDCEDCEETIGQLRSIPEVEKLVREGVVAVLAIDAEDDEAAWRAHAPSLPENWTVGFDRSSVIDRETYVFTSTPTLYLLDRDKNVILKEATVEQLVAYAQTH